MFLCVVLICCISFSLLLNVGKWVQYGQKIKDFRSAVSSGSSLRQWVCCTWLSSVPFVRNPRKHCEQKKTLFSIKAGLCDWRTCSWRAFRSFNEVGQKLHWRTVWTAAVIAASSKTEWPSITLASFWCSDSSDGKVRISELELILFSMCWGCGCALGFMWLWQWTQLLKALSFFEIPKQPFESKWDFLFSAEGAIVLNAISAVFAVAGLDMCEVAQVHSSIERADWSCAAQFGGCLFSVSSMLSGGSLGRERCWEDITLPCSYWLLKPCLLFMKVSLLLSFWDISRGTELLPGKGMFALPRWPSLWWSLYVSPLNPRSPSSSWSEEEGPGERGKAKQHASSFSTLWFAIDREERKIC